MSIIIALAIIFITSSNAWANPACPICTVAVGASLEIARRLGVDDAVVGVWAGALLVMLGFWTIRWFDKKNWQFLGRDFWLISLSVAMIGFMYISELVYAPQPILVFYVDPFLFSTLLGAFIMYYSSEFYQWMKDKNGCHAHFTFEKVVLPVVALLLISVYFYYFPLVSSITDTNELYQFNQ